MPSVRGRERLRVVGALTSTAIGGGTLVGFMVGAVLAPLQPMDPGPYVLVALTLGALADGLWLSASRPRPLSVNRQVPREWSNLFSAPTTAALYGGRLGIGPLTMLSTWLWWAGTIASGLLGVVPAVLFGAAFGSTRALTTVLTSVWAEGTSHQRRFSRLRSMQQPGRVAVAMAVVGGLVLSACSNPSRPEFSTETLPTDGSAITVEPSTEQEDAPTVVVTEPAPTRITPVPDDLTTPMSEEPTDNNDAQPPAETQPSSEVHPPTEDDPLAAALLDDIPGFSPLDDPIANRGLDLEAAANIQPDPTEERPLLETRGFSRGWTRAFRSPSRDVVVITVYEFRDETEAAFYLEDGLITIGGYGGEFFEIPDIEGSRGFRQDVGDQSAEEPLTSVGVTFVRDTQWFLVYLVGATETLDPEIVINAARQQAAKAG